MSTMSLKGRDVFTMHSFIHASMAHSSLPVGTWISRENKTRRRGIRDVCRLRVETKRDF
jgi:hypothetical protein